MVAASSAAGPVPVATLAVLFDGGPQPRLQLVDLRTQVLRVEVELAGDLTSELRGEIGVECVEGVAHHLLGGAVPQGRNRNVAVEAGFGCVVGIAQQRETVDRVGAVLSRKPQPRASRPPAT